MLRFLLLACLLAPSLALATDLHNPSESYLDLLRLVRDNANMWSDRLRGYATSIFWSLATIQLVLTVGPLLSKGSPGQEMLHEIFWYLFKTIFFYSLLHYSVIWGQAIVDSFRQAGAHAAGVAPGLQPGDMFYMAVSLGETISSVSTLNPIEGLGIMLAALIVLISFTFIAAFMGLALIESYVVINAAMFFMGFGGAQVTREYALAMVKYAISVGAKLFVLTLIVGIVMSSAKSWQIAYTHDSASTLTIVGLALMCAIFSKTIPDLVQSLIMGVSPGGGSVIGGMAAAGMAFGGAAMAAISAKLATSNLMSGEGGGLASSIASSFSGGGGRGGGSSSSGNPLGNPPPPPPSSSGGSGARPGFSTPPMSGNAPTNSMAKKAMQAAHTTTAATAKTIGTISAITVPGMESAADMSVGPSPITPSMGHDTPPTPGPDNSAPETPDNVIQPEAPTQSAPQPQPSIDTSSGISDALNNRGNK